MNDYEIAAALRQLCDDIAALTEAVNALISAVSGKNIFVTNHFVSNDEKDAQNSNK